MDYALVYAFSLSICIAGISAIVRYKEINKVFHPVLWCIWYACLNEILNFILAEYRINTYENNNIYTLGEAILLTVFFKRSGLFKNDSWFIFIVSCCVISWILDNIIFGVLHDNSVYFRIIYSFFIVLMSITAMNKLLLSGTKHIFTNSFFLLYAAFIVYFTYKILIETFWLYGLGASQTVFSKIYYILDYINLLCNLIYALAVLWMKKKIAFTLSS